MAKKKQNMAESKLLINGNVTLKFMSGNKLITKKVINNRATLHLLQGIALYLIKESNQELLPVFMGIGSSTDETTDIKKYSLESEYVGKRVVLTRHNIRSTENGFIAPYSATFPSSLVGDNPIGELGLFSTLSGDSMLARVNLNIVEVIPAGLTLIVEWDINIENSKVVA